MRFLCRLAVLVIGFTAAAAVAHAQDEKYTLKTAESKPPSELKPAIAELLESAAVQVFDSKDQLYCEVWFRKSVPAKATEAQVQNGLTYREFEVSTVIGAIRFAQKGKDYRGQDVPAGVYSLRLAYQPQDGDHMGTAPHTEFCLLVAAGKDEKPAMMESKALYDASAKSIGGGHPAVFLLFPTAKPASKPELADQGMGHWVIRQELKAEANGKPAKIGIGLTVAGHSSAG